MQIAIFVIIVLILLDRIIKQRKQLKSIRTALLLADSLIDFSSRLELLRSSIHAADEDNSGKSIASKVNNSLCSLKGSRPDDILEVIRCSLGGTTSEKVGMYYEIGVDIDWMETIGSRQDYYLVKQWYGHESINKASEMYDHINSGLYS